MAMRLFKHTGPIRPMAAAAVLALALGCWAVASQSALAEQSPTRPATLLNLNDCYHRALAQSEALAISEESLRRAEAQYRQVFASLLPQVNLVARQQLQNAGGGGGASGDSGDGGDSGFGGNRADRFDAQVQITQPIFSGFRDYHTLGALRAGQQATSAQIVRDRQTLFLDVSDLFYQTVGHDQDLALLADLDRALADRSEELRKRVDIGRSRRSEWLAARTELTDNQAVIEQVRGMRNASMELLAFLIGRPSETFALAVESDLGDPAPLADFLMQVGHRSDLDAGALRVKASEKSVSAARSAFWPSVDFSFNWLALEEPERNEEWSIFFTASLPVFDGGLRGARVAEQKSLVRTSRLELDQLRRLAEYDVRLAHSRFTSSTAQLLRLREAAAIADENTRAQQEDYELGRAANLDVLNALIRQAQVRRRYAAAGFQTRADLNALHVAAGELPVSIHPGQKDAP